MRYLTTPAHRLQQTAQSRGLNDGRTSSDFEDIVFVLDNRKEVWNEMKNAGKKLRGYLREEWLTLLEVPYLEEWLSAHLEPETATGRTNIMISAMKEFVLND